MAALATERSARTPTFSRRVAEWGVQVAEALEHAHGLGIVHRDVKPANLLVDGHGHLWVMDFGLAQFQRDTRLTMTGDLLGTLRYMSPEQAQGKNGLVDARADVYALGATLYELLTLEPVFPGRDREALLRQITDDEPRPPRRLNPAVPPELETIILKALSKEPAERYQTAQELADDLERFLEDMPIRARRPTVVQRLAKWSRRHADWVAATAVVLSLALAGTGVSAWLIARQRDAAREAGDKASRAEDQARQDAAIAGAVNQFFNQLLRQADIGHQPRGGELNPNITVRELLDRAARQIDGKFQGHELTEAAIRATIGNAYYELGVYLDAEPHLKRSMSLRTEKLGADHIDTRTSMENLAKFYLTCGRYDEAEPLLKQMVEGGRAVLGPDHPSTLRSMNNLGAMYNQRGRYDEAEPLLKQAVEAWRAKQEPNRREMLTCMENLTTLYLACARYDEAESLGKTVLAGRQLALGPDHPDTLSTVNTLGVLYLDWERYDEAEPLLKRVLEWRQAKRGPDHPHTLISMNNLAVLYQQRGQHDKAEPLFKELLAAQRAKRGSDHSDMLVTMNNLAMGYRARGRYDEAEPLLKQALEGLRANSGPDHPDTLTTMNNLALLYHHRGQHDKAESLFKEAMQGRRAKLGPDHPNTLWSLINLAALNQDLARYDQAEALFKEAMERMRVSLGANHGDTLFSMNRLGVVYMAWGRYDEAEFLLKQALHGRRAQAGPDHPDTLMVMNNLASLYQAREQHGEAEALYRQALDGMRAKVGPGHANMLLITVNLSRNLLKQQKHIEAETLLRECLAICERKQPDDWQRFRAQSLLGGSLLGEKKYAEAEPLLLQGYEGLKQREKKVAVAWAKREMPEALERLVQLYDDWGKPDEAARWRKELEARQSRKPPP